MLLSPEKGTCLTASVQAKIVDGDRRLYESDYGPFPKGLCEVGISEKRVYQGGGNAKVHKVPWPPAASSNPSPSLEYPRPHG